MDYELGEDSAERRENAVKVMSLLKYMHKSDVESLKNDCESKSDQDDLDYPFFHQDDEHTIEKKKRVSCHNIKIQ